MHASIQPTLCVEYVWMCGGGVCVGALCTSQYEPVVALSMLVKCSKWHCVHV